MELKYAHLADYAAPGNAGKPIIVGVFDAINTQNLEAIGMPICYLIGAFTARLSEGSEHTLLVKLVDADGNEVLNSELPLKFSPTPRRELSSNFVLALFGVPLPHTGEYAFDLFVDQQLKGSVPFFVHDPQNR